MSVWLFDLGNTRLKIAELQADGQLGPVHAVSHAAADFEVQLEQVLPAPLFYQSCHGQLDHLGNG